MAEVLLDSAPRKTREVFEKAVSAMERGNYDYSIEMFMGILEREPRLLQVRRALRTAQIKKFLDRKKHNSMTHSMSSLAGMGKVMKVQGNLKKKPVEAVQAAEGLMTLDPLNKQFFLLFAKAAEAADLPEAAAQTLETVREYYPDDVGLLEELAETYRQIKNPKGLRAIYEQLVSLKPNSPEYIKSLKDAQAMETMSKGWDQTGQAGDFRKVIKNSEEAQRLEQQAKAVKSEKDLDELIPEWEQRVSSDPNNINFRRTLADFYSKAGRLSEALETLEQATQLSGGGDPQIDRAITKIRNEQFDQRIETLREAGREEEALGVEAEKKEFQLQDAEERVRRYPNDLQFKYEYGVLLFERGQFTEAIQQFQMSQRHAQRRLRSLYYLALCFRDKGQIDIAVEQLEKAASELNLMDDTKKDIMYELGLMYESIGQTDKAMAALKEIYAVDIGYRDVSQRIEAFYKKS